MSIIAQIGDLIAEHDFHEQPFSKCSGCATCDEITRLRKIIDPNISKKETKKQPKQKKVKEKKLKPDNFTKERAYEYIMKGMNSRDMAKKEKLPLTTVNKRMNIWFPNYQELRIKAARENLKAFNKETLTYDMYKEMKKLNICNEEIAKYYGVRVGTINYRLKKWREERKTERSNNKYKTVG